MDAILDSIKNRLAGNAPTLKWIDEDWGQLDYYDPNPPVKFPCALIDAPQIIWSNTARGGQLGNATFKVRVATQKLSNSAQKAPVAQKEKAASIWPLLKEVFKALQAWCPGAGCTSLIRTVTRRVRRDDGILLYEMEFTAQVTDNSAQQVPPASATGLQSGITMAVLGRNG